MRSIVTSLYEYCSKNQLTSLLNEYAPDNPLPADKIGFKSTIECKWVCSHGHIEIESPNKRIRRGYCKICGKDGNGSFGQKYPELVPYWSKGNKQTAFEVSPRYSLPVIWNCEHGHVWERTIAQQTATSSVCPYCKSKENSFFAHKPELLAEWDYETNEDDPEYIGYMSNTKYHWICPEGHRFTASPSERIRRNKSCPVCKSLLMKRPDIALEWHPDKNSFSPDSVTPSSHKEAWFICRNCGKEYICEIVDRVRRKSVNCPNCR